MLLRCHCLNFVPHKERDGEKHRIAVVHTTVSADSKCLLHNHVVEFENVVK